MSSDIYNYLSHLTLSKYINLLKLGFSFYYSRFTKKYYFSGLPASITVEPTTSCNLKCPECPVGTGVITRPAGNMDPGLFNKIIDELYPCLSYMILYFQGEPYLHPNIFDMIGYADKKRVFTAISTNAHYLDEKNAERTVSSGLKKLVISIDGTTQDVYEKYRTGGDLEKVIQGIKTLVDTKKRIRSATPYTVIQFIVFRFNEHQTEDIKKLGKQLGVDRVEIKTAQIYDTEKNSDLIPSLDKYSRYSRSGDGKYSIKSDLPNYCFRMWASAVITWDGKVVPCCFDKNAEHIMGDITRQSFTEIWKGKDYIDFRKAVHKNRKGIDICNNCTEGLRL